MTKVNLPGGAKGGCYGIKMEDGTVYKGRPGKAVEVEDHHARAISKSSNGKLGIVSSSVALGIGTRLGKRCTTCGFLAQGWSSSCPRCGGEVLEEE